MQDVSKGEGRTVLFVSHNMGAIANLCTRCISLENGSIFEDGSTSEVISNYLDRNHKESLPRINNVKLANGLIEISDFTLKQGDEENSIICQGAPFECQFSVINHLEFSCSLEFNVEIKSGDGEPVTCFGNQFQNQMISVFSKKRKQINVTINETLFKKGIYYISLYFKVVCGNDIFDRYIEDALKFEVNNASPIYYVDKNRQWKLFPEERQHGYLGLKIDRLVQKEV